MARAPRFPGIDWYCDKCGAFLNSQKNFDDHKYIWKCRECGYKNSISWANIRTGDSKPTKFLLGVLGFFSYIGFETAIMLAIAMFAFKADESRYFLLFLASLGLYFFTFILTMIVEFGIRHTTFNGRNLRIVFLRNIKEDIIAPFMCLKELMSNLLSFATHLIPIKRKYVWYSNKAIVVMSIVYTLITIFEIIAFSRIIGWGLNDWGQLLNSIITWGREMINR